MIVRSILSSCNISRHNLSVLLSHQKSHLRSLSIGRPLYNGDKSLWIEDNLLLDIKTTEDETTIEAIPKSTGRESRLIPIESSKSTACALCRLNLNNLDYTDVMILSQFIKKNGILVTFHESKLCSKQYRKVVDLVKKAQRCNLIERPTDYLMPGPWHDLNTYIEPDRRRDQPMKVIKKEYWRI